MVAQTIIAAALPVLAEILGGALERMDHPAANDAANAIKRVDQAIKNDSISLKDQKAAYEHIEKMVAIHQETLKTALSETNETARTELASDDAYVRRMRPTFGYLMAITWTAQMLAIAYVILFKTEFAGALIGAMDSLSVIWAVGLSVLGVYVYKRSQEKIGPSVTTNPRNIIKHVLNDKFNN